MTDTVEILSPIAPPAGLVSSPTYRLDRRLDATVVGLRLDRSWRSYFPVVDTWEALFRSDGARTERLVTGDRVGPGGERTRSDLEDWSRLVDCGVVGLGN